MHYVKYQLIFFFLLSSFFGYNQQDSIKVLSWNVFLRPSLLKDGQMERAEEIADYLKNSDADVLVLQELFHSRARKVLRKALKNTYPYQTKKGPVSWLGIPSGVVFFSKLPILKEKRISFSFSRGSDRFAKKGAIVVTIKKDNQHITILGTHLQAGSDSKTLRIRSSQIDELCEVTNEIDSSKILIYAGDFNIKKESKMFGKLIAKLRSNRPFLTKKSEKFVTANFRDNGLYPAYGDPSWIDFIFIRKSTHVKQKRLWIEEPWGKNKRKSKRLSDHNPIISVVEYTNLDY